jgi:transposase
MRRSLYKAARVILWDLSKVKDVTREHCFQSLSTILHQQTMSAVSYAFVDGLKMVDLGFERAEAAQTGRPGYDPRDLLKLYLYGYLNQIRPLKRGGAAVLGRRYE